jgi:hypothetical protein
MAAFQNMRFSGVGGFINRLQTLFVGILRIWTIPIVLMLSVASGFTTYYGMSHFITPWIALVITVAIQSIIVICSLEIANIHWQANRVRYMSVLLSLMIAIMASITFSYFKFYEISQQQTIHIDRLNQIKFTINGYLNKILLVKTEILAEQRKDLEQASKEASAAYFGTHPLIFANKNQVGEGPFWRHYNQLYQDKKQRFSELEAAFSAFDNDLRQLQDSIRQLGLAEDENAAYQAVLVAFNNAQLKFSQLATGLGKVVPEAPVLMSYAQFILPVQPAFSMWQGFSWFAFICAAMVDFFTVLLSYRLEFTAPGPLTGREQDLIFECLKQFTEFRINGNDELEIVIEKSELEKARRYSDWPRMFAIGFLLSRGFLRKVDGRTVEFAPNLYPLVAEHMADKIQALKAASTSAISVASHE